MPIDFSSLTPEEIEYYKNLGEQFKNISFKGNYLKNKFQNAFYNLGSKLTQEAKRSESQKENYFLTEADRQKWIANLISGISTQTQAEMLSQEEALAREGASEATKAATRRGAAYTGKLAEKEGIQNLEMFAKQFNQRGQAAVDQYWLALQRLALMEKQLEQEKELQEQSNWINLLGGVGMAAGYFFQPLATKWFSGNKE